MHSVESFPASDVLVRIYFFNFFMFTCLFICHMQISKTKVFLRAGQMAEFDGCRTKVLSYTT